MTHPLRFAVYRDRAPLSAPTYLGDVLAVDRDEAVRLGEAEYSAPVVAHRASAAPRPGAAEQLERAVASLERRRPRGDGPRGARRPPQHPMTENSTKPNHGASL